MRAYPSPEQNNDRNNPGASAATQMSSAMPASTLIEGVSNIHDTNVTMPVVGTAAEFPAEQYVIAFEDATRNHSDFLRDILGSRAASPTSRPTCDIGTDRSWDLFSNVDQKLFDFGDLTTADLQSLNTFFPDFMDVSAPIKEDDPKSFEDLASTATSEAFKASGWDWGPTQDDSGNKETRNFILPVGCDSSETSASRSRVNVLPILRARDRTRLLSLLLQHCAKEQWIAIAPTFPSETFLDQLLRRFLASQRNALLPWFHVTALQLDALGDEFLASIIATGACQAPVVPVQRFGYSMPEMLRHAIVQCVSSDPDSYMTT